jgi:integrase
MSVEGEFKRPNPVEAALLSPQAGLSLADKAFGHGYSASESIMLCAVVTIRFRSVGYLPVIIDEGRVNVDILEYLQFLKEQEKADSTLILRATALRRFLDFYRWALPNASERPIIRAFFEALFHGNPELGWESVSLKTARRYVETIALFLDYFCDAHGIASPNPLIEEPRSWVSTIWERIRRYRSDPLYHLFDTTRRSSLKKRRLYLPAPKGSQAISIQVRKKKTFDYEEFIKLIEFERNARNRQIWLLLGAGGLRESEVVHLFTWDITYEMATHEESVLLAHPTYGTVEVENRRFTRQAYLKDHFGRLPRDQLPAYDLRQAGWKGMRFQTGDTAGVTWLNPSFGVSAWQAHLEYLPLRVAARAHHPWYFVNFKHCVGEPLTLKNLYQQLDSACKKLGLHTPSNPHALRHMYVDTIVNVLGMSLEDAQILVRHRDPASTAEYARASRRPEDELSTLRGTTATQLREHVAAMPIDNFLVRDKRRLVEKYSDPAAWEELDVAAQGELTREVAGLPSVVADADLEAKQFDVLLFNLQLSVLRVEARFDELKESVIEFAGAMEEKQAIPMVREQLQLIEEVQTTQFWQGVTVPELETVRLRLRALCKFIDKKRRNTVYTNFEDELRSVEVVHLPIYSAGVDPERFREKALAFLRENFEHPSLHKVRWNQPLTPDDLDKLEKMFVEAGIAPTKQLHQEAEREGGLGLLIRSLIGLDRVAAKKAFSGFVEKRTLTADQLVFVNLVVEHLTQCGWMRPEQLYASPFTDEFEAGPNAVFSDARSLQDIIGILSLVRQNATDSSIETLSDK